jgi:hypothetical protein
MMIKVKSKTPSIGNCLYLFQDNPTSFTTMLSPLNTPENNRSWHTEFDENFLDVVMERLFIQIPRCLIIG